MCYFIVYKKTPSFLKYNYDPHMKEYFLNDSSKKLL